MKKSGFRNKDYLKIALIWSLVAFFFLVQNYVQAIANDRSFQIFGYTKHQLSNFWLWALMTPLVFSLLTYLGRKESQLFKFAIFLFCGVLISIVHSFIFNLTSIELRYNILEIEQLKGYLTLEGLLPIAISGFFSSFLTFVLFTGAIHAW